jgi:hypothetical protein
MLSMVGDVPVDIEALMVILFRNLRVQLSSSKVLIGVG